MKHFCRSIGHMHVSKYFEVRCQDWGSGRYSRKYQAEALCVIPVNTSASCTGAVIPTWPLE